MHTLLLPCLLLIPATELSEYETGALRSLNAYRKVAGLGEVSVDAELSKSCEAHARYLLQNFDLSFVGKLNVHDEDPKLAGFSEDGRKAARASVVAQLVGDGNPLVSIDAWMASFYHRVPLLDPALKRVGLALVRDVEKHHWILVLDKARGIGPRTGPTAVCYPMDGQKGVPRLFSMGAPEVPNPIPDNGDSRVTGHPITVSIYQHALPAIKNATASLSDGEGRSVDIWLSWQEKPAVRGYGGNTICVIPKAPLATNGSYTVEIKATINGKEWSRTWSFTTGER
jgi:hypothetical protein